MTENKTELLPDYIERANARRESRLVRPFFAKSKDNCQICCRCGKPMLTIGNQYTCDICYGVNYTVERNEID